MHEEAAMKAKVEELAAGVREFDVEIYRGEIVARAREGENCELEWSSDPGDQAAL